MCVMRHSAMAPRRLPQIRIDLVSGDKALGKKGALLLVRERHPVNENSRSIKQEGLWRRLHLLFAKHLQTY